MQSLIQKFDNREIENLERKGRAKKQGMFSAKKETISMTSKGSSPKKQKDNTAEK